MSILKVLLFILLMASDSLSEQAALEPNCTGVEDFKACLGNTDGFCPTNIPCQCKNEKPFCRCNNFRVGWKDYWYMGPKCNHLWNTSDLILVTVLPPVALVMIVVAIFYCVHYCGSEKARKRTNPPYPEAQHNPAFTADMAGNAKHVHPPSPGDVWTGHIPKAILRRQDSDDFLNASQLENYSRGHPQPRRPDPATDRFPDQRSPYEKFGSPRHNLPYAGYAERSQYRQY